MTGSIRCAGSGRARARAARRVRGVFAIVGLVAAVRQHHIQLRHGLSHGVRRSKPLRSYVADVTGIALVQSNGSYGLSYSNGFFGKTIDFAKLADTTEVWRSRRDRRHLYIATSRSITLPRSPRTPCSAIVGRCRWSVAGRHPRRFHGSTAGSYTYTVKFDPCAHPLVVRVARRPPRPALRLMNVATVLNTATSPSRPPYGPS